MGFRRHRSARYKERDLNFSEEYHGTSGPIPCGATLAKDWLAKSVRICMCLVGYESCSVIMLLVSVIYALNQIEGVRWSQRRPDACSPGPNLQIMGNVVSKIGQKRHDERCCRS